MQTSEAARGAAGHGGKAVRSNHRGDEVGASSCSRSGATGPARPAGGIAAGRGSYRRTGPKAENLPILVIEVGAASRRDPRRRRGRPPDLKMGPVSPTRVGSYPST